MDIASLHSASLTADLPLERLTAHPRLSEPQKVEGLARQFEAVLLRQILAAGRRTVITSEWSRDSAMSAVYQDMINYQLAESISRSGSFGLAQSLQAQLTHQTRSAPDGADPAARPGPIPAGSPSPETHD